MFTTIDIAAIRALSARERVPVEWALGLAEVESAGRAFWTIDGKQLPAINLEGHYFYRLLSPQDRIKALSLGLAHPTAGKTVVPNSFAGRYLMLRDWLRIDATAALKSISMGVGQVMGEHHDRLGYDTVEEMWGVARSSLAGQAEIMLRFLTTDAELFTAVRDNQYERVARIYNGPKYKTNSYDTKIKAAVEKWQRGSANPAGIPRYNTDVELASITALGFATVKAFQQSNGLTADGIIGPITREKIEAAKVAAKAPVTVATKATIGAVVTGTIGYVTTEVTGALQQVDGMIAYIKLLGTYGPPIALVGVGSLVVGVTAYSFYKAARNAQAI